MAVWKIYTGCGAPASRSEPDEGLRVVHSRGPTTQVVEGPRKWDAGTFRVESDTFKSDRQHFWRVQYCFLEIRHEVCWGMWRESCRGGRRALDLQTSIIMCSAACNCTCNDNGYGREAFVDDEVVESGIEQSFSAK